MLFLKLSNISKNRFLLNGFSNLSSVVNVPLILTQRVHLGINQAYKAYISTFQGNENDVKMSLGKSLASIDVDSSHCEDVKDNCKSEISRVGMKRLFEARVKKRVKQHYVNGMFHDLFRNVVADHKTLMDAYNCIRVCSNVDIMVSEDVGICLSHIGRACEWKVRCCGSKEVLVLPNLKLRVVQECNTPKIYSV